MGGVVEAVDEILSKNSNAAGLVVNWQLFGSNGQEKADYSRGVLERFTRRAPRDFERNIIVKTVANPRAIEKCGHPHYVSYFEGLYAVNENGGVVKAYSNKPVTVDKIALNHYYVKSKEEAEKKFNGIRADTGKPKDKRGLLYDRNDEFDDGILKYRDARAKVYQPPDNSHADERLLNALERNLSPALKADTPPDFYAGKMETFLTCRAVASYLKTKLKDDKQAKFFEETALKAVLKSLEQRYTFADAGLLVKELPKLLKLPYPAVEELRKL